MTHFLFIFFSLRNSVMNHVWVKQLFIWFCNKYKLIPSPTNLFRQSWKAPGSSHFHFKRSAPNKPESFGVSEWLRPVAGEQPGLDALERQVGYKLSLFDSDFSSFSTPQVKWFFNLFSSYGQCEWNNVRSNTRFELLSHLVTDQSVLVVVHLFSKNCPVYDSTRNWENVWPWVA